MKPRSLHRPDGTWKYVFTKEGLRIFSPTTKKGAPGVSVPRNRINEILRAYNYRYDGLAPQHVAVVIDTVVVGKPLPSAPPPQTCSSCGKTDSTVKEMADPYASEIFRNGSPSNLCPDCEEQSAGDI